MKKNNIKKKLNKLKTKISNHKLLFTLFCLIILLINISAYFLTYGEFVSSINSTGRSTNNSRIEGNTVYIDDFDTTWNYYQGLNYTEITSDSIPTYSSRYNRSNMVSVTLTYSGTDFSNSSLVGHISPTESQDTMVYYRWYPIVSGYIEIELIDNPFTARPTGKGFNGWATDYPGAILSYDESIYTRYLKVPVSSTNPISIDINAVWTNAIVDNNTTALNNVGMYSVGTISAGQNMTSYFYKTNVSGGDSSLFYNATGQSCATVTCSSGNTYKLIQNSDPYANPSGYSASNYYYLATRDTNILLLTNNQSLSGKIGSVTKPMTVTMSYDGTAISSSQSVVGASITANADLTIENIRISGTTTSNSTSLVTSRLLDGYDSNLKVGRNVINTEGDQYELFNTVVASNPKVKASSTNIKRFKLIVESGTYGTIAVEWQNNNFNGRYIWGEVVTGSDYDRAINDNSKLTVYNNVYGNTKGGYNSLSDRTEPITDINVKSGRYGVNYSGGNYSFVTTYSGEHVAGIYLNSDATQGSGTALRALHMWGGEVATINGGQSFSAGTTNACAIYMLGGKTATIIGGAATNSTYGNRIISVTGGLVQYNVFGGSNSSATAIDGAGDLDGSTVIYIGGDATIGDDNASGTLYGASKGSVFGAGDGNPASTTGGVVDNSHVIVSGYAIINGDVYGGSNYGVIASHTSGTGVLIDIEGGDVKGSVYGGGNNAGIGSTTVTSNVQISMIDGEVETSIYGGANVNGIIYGSANISITGGTVGNAYGGGQGENTFVSNNIDITIGNSTEGPEVTGNIYGGSAYGTTNAITNSAAADASKHTYITVNNGTIDGAVFGGAKGDSTTEPYVKGNIVVTINDGDIGEVYGGFDVNGEPVGTDYVYLNGGTITDAYGGGKNTGIDESHIYLQGASITGSLYGGSNQSGNVPVTNVIATSGTANNIYGGNNVGGSVTTANVLIDGATVTGSAFGGGNLVNTTTAIVEVESGTINNVFGGGNSASLTNPSDVTINGGTITNVYGGSNQTGNVPSSNIDANGGTITNIFGANNEGGLTSTTNIKLNGSTVTGSVYGGGNEAASQYSHIEVNNGLINNIFGGGNSAGLIESDIKLINGQVTNVYGGSNQTGNVTESNIYTTTNTNQNLEVTNIYGGNNEGGKTSNTNITLTRGEITNVYGGGNEAPVDKTNVNCNGVTILGQLYGGGNAAAVTGDTNLNLINTTISGSVYGGGNAGVVNGDTNVYVSSSTIGTSLYAGGNGSSAIVEGNTNLIVDGTTSVTRHVFGGGNAAATGTLTDNNSSSNVYIAGANIGGNVYGGANTSVVYGTTNLYIGYDTIENNEELIKGNIHIGGTVFGGGEANESGSTEYDFSFISVTKDILIKIDGNGHNNFDIDGSIFGSGNASSSAGDSYIYIDNYGTSSDVKSNISIQRAKEVTISNSYLSLSGAADRTNEFDAELFTISRVDLLKIKNNTSIYLETSANLLKHFMSLVDIGNNEVLATVIIDEETGEVTKNVDNRVYVLAGKHLNILTAESLASNSYGDVDGMSFFGMFNYDRNHNVETAMYDSSYDAESTVPSGDLYYFSEGSYVLGAHKTNHDITVDGFYSNYVSEEEEGKIKVKYVEVTPPDSNFYMWSIGEQVDSYEMDLAASKYLTLGTEDLQLVRHTNPNTTFTILGFNYSGLNSDVNLLPETSVPRIASSTTSADTNMSLVMKTPSSGWMTNGSTTFMSNDALPISGTTTYRTENSSNAPVLQFYLYHSKNLGTSGPMGTVTISLLAITRIDDLTNEAERINIEISLSRMLFNTSDYEAAIATGKHYDLFSSEQINTTTDSSISAYYSLYVEDASNFYRTGYHRALVSDYVLPENTKITMIDYHDHNNPEYYYYVVSSSDYTASQTAFNTDGEVAYNLSNFIRMGSTSSNNNYNDALGNTLYYDTENEIVNEEFVFIVDFSGAGITTDVTNKSLLIELRDSDDNVKVSVLGLEQTLMFYNLYYNKNAIIDIDGTLDNNNIHPGESVGLTVTTDFITQKANNNTVVDTSFYDKQLGIKITLYDQNGNQVTGASLLGISYTLDGVDYYPRTDGTLRLNISERVTNVSSRIKFNTTESIAPGNYTMKIESFGSADGIYYGLESSDYTEIEFVVLDTVYGLKVTLPEKQVIIDKETGKTLNKNNIVLINYNYNSVLNNPNIHISLQRRKYDAVYSRSYELVDFKDYFTNNYTVTSIENEYILTNNPRSNSAVDVFLYLKDNLMSGTYRIVLTLYDGNRYIGDVYQYIIIK